MTRVNHKKIGLFLSLVCALWQAQAQDPDAAFDFLFLDGTQCQGSTIQFQNNSSSLSGGIVLTIWDFGDGNSSNVFAPNHVYSQAGNYTVTLTVYNEDNDFAVTSKLVTVDPLPVVNFQVDASVTNSCESTGQLFDNLSSITGDLLSYSWEFGDGNSSTATEPTHNYSDPGTYTVKLTATGDVSGCTANASSTLVIHPEAVVDFNFQNQCEGTAIPFVDATTIDYGNVSYQWTFGDGNSSAQQHPDHLYAEANTYHVNLRVTSQEGCVTQTSKTVEVLTQPQAAFTFSNVCDGSQATFTNTSHNADSYLWYFGDGHTSTLTEPSHTYAQDSTYTVSLVARNTNGCVDSTAREITIFPLPETGFTATDVCQGLETSFTNTSQIPSGTLSYSWTYGDGATATIDNPDHIYEAPGSYPVGLTSTSNHGCLTTTHRTITVYDQPDAAFTVDDVCVDTLVALNNTTSTRFTSTVVSYDWDLDDGTTSTDKDPSHQYESSGTYSVTLKATTEDNCTSVFSDEVGIRPLPIVNFDFDHQCDTVTVPFSNLSAITSGAMTYAWEFGDGTISIAKDPKHRYGAAGTYEVTLTATSSLACTSDLSKAITIYPRPEAAFTVPSVCDGEPSVFTQESKLSSGAITSGLWDFGDGTNSIVMNPEKQYLNPGTYKVSLVVTSDQGCQDAVSGTAIVHEFPIADFEIDNVCTGFPIQPENTSMITTGDLSFEWDFGDGNTSEEASPIHVYELPGAYTITLRATSSTGCSDVILKDVIVYDSPKIEAGADVTVSQGFSAQLEASLGMSYAWEPVDGLDNSSIQSPRATPTETTTYTVRVIDELGCQGQDTVTVNVKEDFVLVANNVFTPDGNGQNDTWIIQNVETFGNANVRIFDRYGTVVFQETDYQNDWNGTFGNDILPDGTYFYLITFSNAPVEYKGSVTIIRNR
ncbi:MAG: PKD domain-containing protein [Bacteroidota bacterium]